MATKKTSVLTVDDIEQELLLDSDVEYSESDDYDSSSLDEDGDEGNIEENVTNSVPGVFNWENMSSYVGVREVFSCDYGPQGAARSAMNILSIFKLFFDYQLVSLIVEETNRYAEQYMRHRGMLFSFRSRVRVETGGYR